MRAPLLVAAAAAAMLVFGGSLAPPAPRDRLLEAIVQDAATCSPQEGLARRAAFGVLLSGAAAWAQAQPVPRSDQPPPLMTGLGNAALPIKTASSAAQAYFNQGVNMLHGFNHAEAVRAFRYAQTLDPQCAMCFWGEAFALGPNINAPMIEADHAPALAATQAALARINGVSPVERALIEAMKVRYAQTWSASRGADDLAFAESMEKVAIAFPENDLVQILSAEADMDTQPWSYWRPGGREPIGRAANAIARVEKVLARNPTNAGAIHLYIHLAEASSDPWRAEAAAERLEKVAPNAGHLVHMPGHIYYRVGRFKDSMEQNIRAAKVDEAYIAAANPSAIYQYGYYTHNLHFVVTSAQQGGDQRTALLYADKVDAAVPDAMAAQVDMAQTVKASAWFARAQFEDPAALLARPAPLPGPGIIAASWRYARAEALLRKGDLDQARAEAKRMSDLSADPTLGAYASGRGRDVVAILADVIEGKALMAEGRYDDAIARLRAAVALQDTLPYMEPPWLYYPTGRTLGAAYLKAGRSGAAEQEFVQVLLANPNDAYAYWGIAEARKMRGDRAGARAARDLFRAAFLGKRNAVTLKSL